MCEIVMFGANFAPRAWAYCDGQILPINSNQSLYSLLGTTYGGDGRTSFALPDLRGRVPVSQGTGPGLNTVNLGEKGGSETNTLNRNNLPVHNHTATAAMHVYNSQGRDPSPKNNVLSNQRPANPVADTPERFGTSGGSDTANAVTVTVNNAGSQQAINNIQPILALHYIICLQGLFPSRN